MKQNYSTTLCLRALMLLMLVCASTVVLAQDFTQNGVNYSINNNDGTAYVDDSPDATGAITILDKITVSGTSYTVKSIDSDAFRNNDNITSVVIPNSVTQIGSYSFEYCHGLTKVTIGTGVTYIGGDAFYQATALTDVYMNANPETLQWEDWGFDDFIRDGSTICHVANAAPWIAKFGGRINIKFRDPNTVPFSWSFNESTHTLTVSGTEEMPNSQPWSSIQNQIEKVVIEEGVLSIGSDAFYSCTKLKEIKFPSTLIAIRGNAFASCTSLKSIIWPSSVTVIEGSTFACCTNLVSVFIPNTVTNIDSYAFDYCTSLKSINIPASVTYLPSTAFYRCFKLTSINIASDNKNYKSINGAVYDKEGSTFYICPPGRKTFSVAQNTLSINDGAFYCCENLASLTLPKSLCRIESYAFECCTNLKTLDIPANVNFIVPSAFAGCTKMTGIYVDKANTTYKDIDGIVYSKDGKTLVRFPAGLSEINIPSSVTTIADRSFTGSYYITSLTIPDQVTKIGDWAFNDCLLLESVTIGSGVKEIGGDSFYYSHEIKDVYFYADPATLTWSDAGCDDFMYNYETICHVFNASAFQEKFGDNIRITYQSDLLPAVSSEKLTDMYLTTYYNSAANVKVDAGTQVYKATLTGSKLTAIEIEDGIINAGQGVILKSKDATVAMAKTTKTSQADYSGNVLEGVNNNTSANSSYKYYTLASDGALGFLPFTKSTLPAHKAFIKRSSGPAAYRFDDVTGIEEFDNEQLTTDNGEQPIYNLAGQRLGKMQKGINIVGGRKVLVK